MSLPRSANITPRELLALELLVKGHGDERDRRLVLGIIERVKNGCIGIRPRRSLTFRSKPGPPTVWPYVLKLIRSNPDIATSREAARRAGVDEQSVYRLANRHGKAEAIRRLYRWRRRHGAVGRRPRSAA